jgi:hypothetical protein
LSQLVRLATMGSKKAEVKRQKPILLPSSFLLLTSKGSPFPEAAGILERQNVLQTSQVLCRSAYPNLWAFCVSRILSGGAEFRGATPELD